MSHGDKMPRKPQFNIRLDETEKDTWKTFAKEYTHGRIATLIKESVEIVMRNPALLDPTKETTQILKDLERGYELEFNHQETMRNDIEATKQRTESLEAKMNAMMNHFEITISKPATLGDLIDEEI